MAEGAAAGTRGPHSAEAVATQVGADASLSHLAHPFPRIQGSSPEGNRSLPTAGIPADATRISDSQEENLNSPPRFSRGCRPGRRRGCPFPRLPCAHGHGRGSAQARQPWAERPTLAIHSYARRSSSPRRAAPGSGQLPPVCSALLAVPRPPRPPGTASSCKYGGARPPRLDPQVEVCGAGPRPARCPRPALPPSAPTPRPAPGSRDKSRRRQRARWTQPQVSGSRPCAAPRPGSLRSKALRYYRRGFGAKSGASAEDPALTRAIGSHAPSLSGLLRSGSLKPTKLFTIKDIFLSLPGSPNALDLVLLVWKCPLENR